MLLSPLPPITDALTINGYTQDSAAPATDTSPAALKIVLEGSSAGVGANGLRISASNTTIKGLVINRFANSNCSVPSGIGIIISGPAIVGTVIQGNYIGTDVTGTVAPGNSNGGVLAFFASETLIGGTTPAARNLISGNGGVGISLNGGGGENLVQGNYIGNDVTGGVALGNAVGGVNLGTPDSHVETTAGTMPGEPCTGACNVISGNGQFGVRIRGSAATFNKVQGNYIGTDVTGMITDPDGIPGTGDELGNGQFGVEITDFLGGIPSSNTIGGATPEARNVISVVRTTKSKAISLVLKRMASRR